MYNKILVLILFTLLLFTGCAQGRMPRFTWQPTAATVLVNGVAYEGQPPDGVFARADEAMLAFPHCATAGALGEAVNVTASLFADGLMGRRFDAVVSGIVEDRTFIAAQREDGVHWEWRARLRVAEKVGEQTGEIGICREMVD